MISKLPRWIEYGAFVLALVAGCINAIGLLGFQHQSVSHLSGTATLLGTSFLGDSFENTLHLAAVLFAFFTGASISGFILHGGQLKLGRRYDIALFLEAMFIFVALFFLSKGYFSGQLAASLACGIQNGLATTYSGAVIRTTHLTGIFTDLGLMLGSGFKGERLDKRKAMLFAHIIVGFVLGGTLGGYLFISYSFQALWVPGCICLILAAAYRAYLKS
ncbi:YoaK family protein [Zhongshania aquimaris]|uniref:DUF1275 domain-containing protein n=1 Tax=Zhongshania aquimaris TaxID=2857107 RepID=A0ABS6VRR0_9GAMM|nr:YoaK family protein [Zhongshania aquimaris]MBW2941004.1 DUF1275 domain-containing protein [Zhongshania aquimaris]